MRSLRYNWILRTAALCSLLMVASAFADEVKDEGNTDPMQFTNANCDLQGYKMEMQEFPTPVPIPDGDPNGVIVGPIIVPDDGSIIADVVIDLLVSHTWLGDLIAQVGYDATCDGSVDVFNTIIARPGVSPTSTFGCSSNLLCANTYLFDDTGVSLPTTPCTSSVNIPGGCYRPTGTGSSPLSVFDNLRKGGCWYLFMSDNAAADTGTICKWSVHILNQPPIGVESASWGNVKALFQ